MKLSSKSNYFVVIFLFFGLLAYKPTVFAQINVPEYQSNQNANHTLFLHFGNHTQEGSASRCPDGSLYQGYELPRKFAFSVQAYHQLPQSEFDRMVYDVWQIVSDDFSPFNVNVVTGKNILDYSDSANHNRAVIYIGTVTNLESNVLGRDLSIGHDCEGNPTYENNDFSKQAIVDLGRHSNLSNKALAKSVSHEAGHIYGLAHQFCTQLLSCPIMSYNTKDRYLWAEGRNQQNNFQDDVLILTNLLGLRSDDHSNTPINSSVITPFQFPDVNTSPRIFSYGVLEQQFDKDVFKFRVTGAGKILFTSYVGVHADISKLNPDRAKESNVPGVHFEVKDKNGVQVITQSFPSGIREIDALLPNQTSSQPYLIAGQTYLLEISGTGNYGEIGMYTIFADGPVADFSGPQVLAAGNSCKKGQDEIIRIYFDQALDRSSGLNTRFGFNGMDNMGRSITAKSLLNPNPTNPTPRIFDVVFPSINSNYVTKIKIGVHPIKGYGLDDMGQPYWMNQDNDENNGVYPNDIYKKSYLREPLPCLSIEKPRVFDYPLKTKNNLTLGN